MDESAVSHALEDDMEVTSQEIEEEAGDSLSGGDNDWAEVQSALCAPVLQNFAQACSQWLRHPGLVCRRRGMKCAHALAFRVRLRARRGQLSSAIGR